jgi:hypothetical protein
MSGRLSGRMRTATARLGVLVTFSVFGVGSFAASLGSACIPEGNPQHYTGDAATGYCSGLFAKPVPPAQCPGCSGSAYALCNGNTFNECVCDLPSYYSLDAGTFDASMPLRVEGGLGGFEGGYLSVCCAGDTYLEVPASSCGVGCAGTVAYALCHDNAFTECSCSIPPGYTLPTITCDGG